MTYNVFGGTLSLTQSINQSIRTLYLVDILRLKVPVVVFSIHCRTCMEQSSYQHHSINLFAIFQETT